MNAGVITGVCVSHENASVDEIEAACDSDQRETVERLIANEAVDEAFAIQTCNRFEAYVVCPTAGVGLDALASLVEDVDESSVVWMDHETTLRHLMRLAAGLESLVLGEDQIIGQFKRAVEDAREAGSIGTLLEDATLKAIHVGERARTETAINDGTVSLGSAAVELIENECELPSATVLVVGAGEMATLAAKALDAASVDRLFVANRTVETAAALVSQLAVDGRAHGLDDVSVLAKRADALITATGSPDPIVTAEMLADAGPTVVVDVSRPRNVEPAAAALPHVDCDDLDSLGAITAATNERRERAAATVEAMIDDEYDHLLQSFKRKRADEAIAAMYETAESLKRRELEEAISRLESRGGVTEEEREIVESLADALVNQLLAAPTKSLREAAIEDDWSTINTALGLFDPRTADESVDSQRADTRVDFRSRGTADVADDD